MTEETQIDRAHARMQADPEDDTARLAFYERLGDAELFLLLEEEPQRDAVTPRVFDLGDARVVLVFDREERLSAFVGHPSPYAALSGRAVVTLLANAGLGLALNPEVAPSSFVLPVDGMRWLSEMLRNAPTEISTGIAEVLPPTGLPERMLEALDAKLATAGGLARLAYLAAARYRDGGRGHLLGVVDPIDGAEPAIAQAVSEALTFSGIEAGALDVVFLAARDEMAARLARVGLRFDLPEPVVEPPPTPSPPGSDPARPPILRRDKS